MKYTVNERLLQFEGVTIALVTNSQLALTLARRLNEWESRAQTKLRNVCLKCKKYRETLPIRHADMMGPMCSECVEELLVARA